MSDGRVPPHDLGAESTVLAAVMLERGAIDRAMETLKPEHFYAEANRRVFEAACALAAKGVTVDLVTVAGYLRDRERLAQVGGAVYLAELVNEIASVASIDGAIDRIREKWRVRQLIATCQRIAAEGYGDVGEDTQQFMEKAEQAIYELAHLAKADDERTLAECAAMAYKQIVEASERGDGIRGARTGLRRFDAMLDGLLPGKLTIVAAQPGAGKSVFVQTIARSVATLSGGAVGVQIFSPEMLCEEIGERSIASEARIDSFKFRRKMDAGQWNAIASAMQAFQGLPVWVTDDPDVTVSQMRGRVRARQSLFDRYNGERAIARVGVVMLDYLQLMNVEEKKGETREQQVGNIARQLKRLAKKLKVHVIAISSLTKETDKRPDKRATLSDLRESGAVSFHADNVVLLYRESYYNPKCVDPHVVEVNVAKQRGGPTGVVKLGINLRESRFENLDDSVAQDFLPGVPALPERHWADTDDGELI